MTKLKNLLAQALANDSVERAVKTFVQAFVSTIIALVPVLQKGVTASVAFAAAVSAGAAGLSAVWNQVVKPWLAAKRDEKGQSTVIWILAVVGIIAIVLWALGR